ncbi:MAG: inverse autotransporter beta domain-containing protein, partial [Gammaproteobacteria bacterium]|nr:inverse autotransporter beta domain-containing protein [Gammaproteobacteria bacterium]
MLGFLRPGPTHVSESLPKVGGVLALVRPSAVKPPSKAMAGFPVRALWRRSVFLLGVLGPALFGGVLQGSERKADMIVLPDPTGTPTARPLSNTPPLLEISADFPPPDNAYLAPESIMPAPIAPVAAGQGAASVATLPLPLLGGGADRAAEGDSWRHRLRRRMQGLGQGMISPQRVSAVLEQVGRDSSQGLAGIGGQLQRDALRAVVDTGIEELKSLEGTHLRNLEVRYRTPLGDQKGLLGVDALIALLHTQQSALFGQVGTLLQDDDESVNAGLGYRRAVADGVLLLGINAFYDYLSDPGLHRYSLGLEAKGRLVDWYANWYRGDADRDSGDYVYTPDGWDIEVAGRLPALPWVEFWGRYYAWNRLRGQADQEGLRYGLKLQPVPMVSLETQYDSPDVGKSDWGVEAAMQYQFGVPLAAQLRPHSVQARGPVHRRFEQVRREHELRVERVAEQAQGGSAGGAAGVVDSLHSYVEVHGAENVPFEGDGLPVPVHGEQRMTIHIAMNNPQGSGQAGGLQAEAAGEIVLEFQNGIYGVDYEILIADMRTEGGVNHRLDVDTDSVASLVLTPHSGVRQFRVAVPLRVLPVMALGKQLRMMVLVQDLPEFPEQSFDIFRVVAAAADTPGMTFSESSLTVGEGGSASYTVALDTEPTASVTVAVSSSDTESATVSPTSLTFAADAWSTAQTV